MGLNVKAAALSLGLLFAVVMLPALAQDQGPGENGVSVGERQQIAASLIGETVKASRVPEIYADLRRAIATLYLPYMKEQLAEGEFSQLGPDVREQFEAVSRLLDYSLRAAEELEPVWVENYEAMIGDVAGLLAEQGTGEQLRLAGEMLRTPAARKGFSTLYAYSRLLTAFTIEDVRQSKAMSEWMKDLKFDAENNPFTNQEMTPPPRERVAKAQAIVTDFMRISRIDDMVGEITRFSREVVLNVETLEEAQRTEVREGIEKFEFYYNLGKSMALAVAPSSLATALDDDQLAKFHLLVLSPVMAKTFGLFHDLIREATSFTSRDISEFSALAEEAEEAKEPRSPAEQRQAKAEWEALAAKWRDVFESRLSPETRAGLEQALEDLQALAEDRKRERGIGAPEPDTREL
jgi:hypothetical protein